MGDYSYRARHEPPRRTDRGRIRPFEHGAAILNTILGVVLICEGVLPGEIIGVYMLPSYIYTVLGCMLAFGGPVALAGLQWPRKSLSIGWAVERSGWLSSTAGWFCILGVIILVSPFMTFGFLLSLFMFGCSALRFDLLRDVEQQSRATTGKEA